MGQDIWFKSAPSIEVAKVAGLTNDQEIALVRLERQYMLQRRPFPDNDAYLAAVARVDPIVVSQIKHFFTLVDGKLHAEWIDRQIAAQDAMTDKKATAGRAGGIKSGKTRRARNNLASTKSADNAGAVTTLNEQANEALASGVVEQEKSRVEDTRSITTTQTSPAKPSAATQPEPGHYAYAGNIIRLVSRDLEGWRKAFPNIPNLEVELTAIDDWLSDHPPRNGKWFNSVAGMLAKKNQERSMQLNILERKANGRERTYETPPNPEQTWSIRAKGYGDRLKRGHHLGLVSDSDIRRVVREGFATIDDAVKAGYARAMFQGR